MALLGVPTDAWLVVFEEIRNFPPDFTTRESYNASSKWFLSLRHTCRMFNTCVLHTFKEVAVFHDHKFLRKFMDGASLSCGRSGLPRAYHILVSLVTWSSGNPPLSITRTHRALREFVQLRCLILVWVPTDGLILHRLFGSQAMLPLLSELSLLPARHHEAERKWHKHEPHAYQHFSRWTHDLARFPNLETFECNMLCEFRFIPLGIVGADRINTEETVIRSWFPNHRNIKSVSLAYPGLDATGRWILKVGKWHRIGQQWLMHTCFLAPGFMAWEVSRHTVRDMEIR